jgi:putative transposase
VRDLHHFGCSGGLFTAFRHYRATKRGTASVRGVRDELLIGEVGRTDAVNCSVSGVSRMHTAIRLAGCVIGWDQVGRLMCNAGLGGITRGRAMHTAVS